MRTLLSQFCEEFEGVVRPLLDPLQETSEALSEASETIPARQILPHLREQRHQLQVVAEKVSEQQAYVLIFGPLKSGKSTLMNAMAAAYVSEVTSLPAYPCMVYVSHAESREFVVTRYDGRTETHSNLTSLRLALTRAHTELAEHLRRIEAEGTTFDAQLHFPEAIRRIDVKLPAGDLAESGAVLVDTPGLYSRMKFGYDRMTVEFRDTAACAIFVVKSENLFLEQVFEEFNDLLELFSRIFLVVNLDTNKKDLTPDGGLTPSLECKDPVRIIEAFENLAMNAPLKAAADEGRLRIYPVDLLRAASRRLRGLESVGEAEAERETFEGQADFDNFLGDLTDYLNSTDYLVAFLSDSIRHATGLLHHIRDLRQHTGVLELGREVDRLESQRERANRRAATLERLGNQDWNGMVDALRSDVSLAVRKRARQIRERTASVLDGAIQGWFRGDASLNGLVVDELTPVLENLQAELGQTILAAIQARVEEGAAGLRLDSDALLDLETVNINLDSIGRSALIQVDSRPSHSPQTLRIDPERIPVRKGFWDWVLFRSQSAVRRRLFGAPSRPTTRIPQSLKTRRLGEAAEEAMMLAVEEQLDLAFPEILKGLVLRVFGDYATRTQEALGHELNLKSSDCKVRLAELERKLEEIAAIRTRLRELDESVDQALGGMSTLSSHYGKTEPEQLLNQLEEPELADLLEDSEVPLEDDETEQGPDGDEPLTLEPFVSGATDAEDIELQPGSPEIEGGEFEGGEPEKEELGVSELALDPDRDPRDG